MLGRDPEVDNTRNSSYAGIDFLVFQYPGGLLSFLKHSQHAMAKKRPFVSSFKEEN